MNTPDFGIYHALKDFLKQEPWYQPIQGFHSLRPLKEKFPYILFQLMEMRAFTQHYPPRAFVTFKLQLWSQSHEDHVRWSITQAIATSLDGACLPLVDKKKADINDEFAVLKHLSQTIVPAKPHQEIQTSENLFEAYIRL